METRKVLGIFAKAAAPGQVKTRLARETSPAWAARVAEAFLRDTVGRTAGINAERILALTPDSARPFFSSAFPDLTLESQGDGDLGQRMQRFLERHSRAGKVVLIGADSPTLPISHVEEAFTLLDRADVVIGPATDGGYYLIGCAGRVPPIFDGIAWGTESVLHETVARLPSTWRLALLPPWYDVDTLADWRHLAGHVAGMRRAGIDPVAPRTEMLLAEPPPAKGA